MASGERFGYEWGKYSEILPVYEEQFLRWSCLFDKEDWKDKSFLDVGCGIGRNSYWPLSYGAESALCIDVDDRTLNSARANLKAFDKVSIEKMSIYNLDEEEKFDIAFSIGVIHHLDNPLKALENMNRSLKSGGKCLIWVYGYENNEWIVKYINPLRRLFFSKMPIGLLHLLSNIPSLFLYLLVRLLPIKIEYFSLLRKFSYPHLRSIVFDQLLPSVANYWTKDEVLALMKDAGFEDLKIKNVNEISWCCVGHKG